MRTFRATYSDRSGRKRVAKRWYVEIKDSNGAVRRLPAFTDHGASEELGRKLKRLVELNAVRERPDRELTRWIEGLPEPMRARMARIGLLDAQRVESSKPLESHVADFREALLARGNTPKHADSTAERVRRVFTACRFAFWTDIRADKVESYLRTLREPQSSENAGKARKPISAQTSNYLLGSCKAFCSWMVQNERASENPLRILKALNAQADRKHIRRALHGDESRALLQATESGPDRLGISGPERAMLYRVAIETGLRARELRSLTRASFALESDRPTVTVQAAYSKRRRQDVLPLKADTARAVERFLRGRLPTASAFRMPAPEKLSKMFRADLDAAGIPYRDESDRVLDFHALRHTFISSLASGGVHPKTAQMLARHSTITLTMDRYTHSLRDDEVKALDALPDLSSTGAQAARATGTDAHSVLASCLASEHGSNETSADVPGLTIECSDAERPRGHARKPTLRMKRMEAAPGLEPGNNGFAIRRLTTWLCRPMWRRRG